MKGVRGGEEEGERKEGREEGRETERKRESPVNVPSYKGIILSCGPIMTPSKPNYLSKPLPANTITWGLRSQSMDFKGHQTFSLLIMIPGCLSTHGLNCSPSAKCSQSPSVLHSTLRSHLTTTFIARL
jgi:hypothetical protein